MKNVVTYLKLFVFVGLLVSFVAFLSIGEKPQYTREYYGGRHALSDYQSDLTEYKTHQDRYLPWVWVGLGMAVAGFIGSCIVKTVARRTVAG